MVQSGYGPNLRHYVRSEPLPQLRRRADPGEDVAKSHRRSTRDLLQPHKDERPGLIDRFPFVWFGTPADPMGLPNRHLGLLCPNATECHE